MDPRNTLKRADPYEICASACKLLDKSVERSAIMVIALRHLAHAHHRAHRATFGGTWPQCSDRFCKMAHDAIDGKLMLGHTTASGKIVALVPANEA